MSLKEKEVTLVWHSARKNPQVGVKDSRSLHNNMLLFLLFFL